MDGRYYRKTAIVVGALFITATVVSIAAMVLLGTSLEEPDYLLGLSDIEDKVVVAVLLELVLAVSLIGIGALMFPVFKRWGEGLAMTYAGFRLTEAVFIIVASTCMLLMLTVGGDYADGTLDDGTVEVTGALLLGLREWAFVIGTLVFLGLGALTLNYLFYRSRLIPRWLSVWGLVGGAGVLVYGVWGLFGLDTGASDASTLLAAPIAVQEMVFASYLIIKGFTAPVEGQAPTDD